MTTRTVSAAGNHVRQPLTRREVETRSLVDMHYQQQLNGNFPLSSPNPLDFSTEVGNKIFSPLFICEGLRCRGARHTTPSRFTAWLTRRMLAVFAGGKKWFGKKGCSMTGTISFLRPPPGTTATFKTIQVGEGKTRVDGRFFYQLSNQEDEDVNVLVRSKM